MQKIITFLLFFTYFFSGFSQKAVPDFTICDIYGHTHNLFTDYLNNGQYVFIDFFSVGCQSCQELSPVLDTVYREFGCNDGDVVFLGIDGYYDDPHVFEFTQDYNMTFPAVSGNEGGGNQVFTNYDINYTPQKILIDPTGKVIADYPFVSTVKYYRDTLLAQGLEMSLCSGNNFWFYALVSANDSITGEINNTEKTINILMPHGNDLSQLRANFIAASNSVVKINGTEQISGETINDFSQGSVIYEITSEDGNTEYWTVTAAISTISDILENNIQIYPNPVHSYFFIDFSSHEKLEITADLLNTNGKKIESFKLTNSNSQINIPELTAGIYFLRIKVKEGSFFKKIIKQ